MSPTSHLTRVNWLVFFAIREVFWVSLSLKQYFLFSVVFVVVGLEVPCEIGRAWLFNGASDWAL